MADSVTSRAAELALQRCDELIAWYERHKVRQRRLDYLLQGTVILAAGLTAFAAAVGGPTWAIVLPAVITTVVTGLGSSFGFRTKYVNFSSAAERLKWVRLRYILRAEQAPGDVGLLEQFIDGMEAIVSAELAEWKEGLLAGDATERSRSSAGTRP